MIHRSGTSSVVLVAGVLTALSCHACFDIRPVTPAERGAATQIALGLIEPSSCLPRVPLGDSAATHTLAFYGFRPFGIGEIDFAAAWARLRLGRADRNLCFSLQRLRALSYNEYLTGLAYRFRFKDLWCQGSLRFGTVHCDQVPLGWALLADVAFMLRIGDEICAVAASEHPLAAGPSHKIGDCPTRIAVGLGYRITDGLAWGVEIEKEPRYQTAVATGIDWLVLKRLFLRSGLKTEPREYCFGMGVSLGKGKVDVGTGLNADLGVTSEFGVTLAW